MKKITFLILTFLLSFSGYSQVLSEGFEGGTFPPTVPGNWAVFQNAFGSNVWTTNTALPHSGTKAAQINSRQNIGIGNTSKDFLATPLVTVPANGQLRFWARSAVNGNQGTKYQIRIASGALPANQTNEAAYTTLVQEFSEDELSTTYNVYEEKIVDLTAYAGQQVYIAFVDEYTQPANTLSGDSWLLDDIMLVSRCLDPTALTATGMTLNSANLGWGNPSGATSWEIEVMPAGPALPTGSGLVVNTNPYTATAETTSGTPLQPATSYKFYVRALCTAVGSQWVGPFTFTTARLGSTCALPIVVPSALPYITNSDTALYGNNIAGPQGAGCAGGATNYMSGNDVVYSYTAAVTTTITITMAPTLTYSSIFVYSSCANIGVSCIAGVANSGSTPRVISNLPVTAGQTYYIVISTRTAPLSTAYNLTIVANTCTNFAATFSVVSDCATAPQFFVRANVTNMGSATSIGATDNQGSAPQTITAPGQVQFGPFPNGTNVTLSLQNQQDANCYRTSGNLTQAFCPATNNLCADAIPIACGGTAAQTTVGATTAGAPTGTCGTTAGSGGLWYSFVGTGDVVTFSLCGSAYDTKIQIVTGACGAFTCVAGNDNSCGTQSQVLINSVLGVNYYVYVYGSGTAQGVFSLNVSCVAPPPPPVNDNCDTAIVVPTNQTEVCTQNAAGTTVGATPSTPIAITPCLGTADDDVWFEFVATNATHIINLTNVVGGTTNLNHIVYSGNICGTLTQLYCSDPNASIASNLTIGNTYKIRVYTSLSVVNQTATFNVCITVPPTNDECATATPTPVNPALACGVFASGAISGATASVDSSTCIGTEDDDVWFSFVATSIKHVVSLTNVVGTTTNLNHAVYSGVCGALVQKYCSVANSLTSTNATFVVGQTYYVRIWSNVATFQAVSFNLCITTPIPPPVCLSNQPAGNSCAVATPICNFNGYCGNSSASYTVDTWPQLSTAFCGSLENDSFLSFVATSTTISLDVWVTSSEDGNGIQMMIFSAATCGSGPVTSLVCWSPGNVPSDSSTVTATGLIPGNTYYIIVDGFAGDVCSYVIAPSSGGSGSGIFTQVAVSAPVSTICLGQSATLTATGGSGSFNWTPTAGLNTTTGTSIVFTPAAVGSYTITATSTDGNPICPLAGFDSETIIVTAPTASTFNPVAPICINDTAPVLPLISNEGFTGTWIPATVDNTQTATYTFTPNAGQCTTSTTLTVTVNATPQASTFNAIAPICANSTPPVLPTTSIEGFVGTWSPAIVDNTMTASYLFTPNAGQCANPSSLLITVNPAQASTFNVIAPICVNDTAPILPTTSNEGFIGTWIPATVDNTQTATYTFTPNAGQCAANATLTVTVNTPQVSTFTAIAPICANATPPVLPLLSNEGFTGIWVPATVDNTQTAVYVFTPNVGQCALPTNLTITITTLPISTFEYDFTTYCQNGTDPILSYIGGGVAGNFSSTTGLSLNTGTGAIDLSSSVAGNYTITNTIAALNGCPDVPSTFNITIIPEVAVEITEACQGPVFTLTALPIAGSFDPLLATYEWTGPNGFTFGPSSSPTVQIPSIGNVAGNYVSTLTYNGCPTVNSHNVASIVCTIQKGISPNGDGENESFLLSDVKKLEIFNRYGTKVYSHGANYTDQWHGQSDKGDELPDGTYYFVIERNAGETETGWIYINR